MSVAAADIAAGGVLDRLKLAAADVARLHLALVEGGHPFLPVRPPRARVLLGSLDPVLELAFRRPVGPVRIAGLSRRRDDAGDMARSRQDEARRPAEALDPHEHRARRSDMVFAR